MVNVDLIHRTLDRIEASPEEWHQQFFAHRTPCGTTMCFAGHALIEAGYTLNGERFYTPTGQVVRCTEVEAETVLGLDLCQSHPLFFWIPKDAETNEPIRVSPADLRKKVADVLEDTQYLNSREQ